jgi:hypothetical protein
MPRIKITIETIVESDLSNAVNSMTNTINQLRNGAYGNYSSFIVAPKIVKVEELPEIIRSE